MVGESGGQLHRGAADLVLARQRLLAVANPQTTGTRQLAAPALRQALADLYELWLSTTSAGIGVQPGSGFALLAVGGLGRREMLPYSDLDLVLLHDDLSSKDVAAVADQLWYPLWDAHLKLDHSVRTPSGARAVAAADLTAALGLLEARHIAGDSELSTQVIDAVRQDWRTGIRDRFDELLDQARSRWERSGEIAHRAEPDLKNGRGGLRDGQLLDALALAQLTDPLPGPGEPAGLEIPGGGVKQAYQRLLDVRTELHLVAGRARDQVRAQDADEIGAALSMGDRFELARTLSECARTVSFSVETGLRTAANALPRRGLARLRRPPVRRPLDEGVVEHGGEVVLARDAHPRRDPGLILRVAAAAAQTGFPIAATTLARLADAAPELREPWPKDALNDLLVLLGSGANAVNVIEALDRSGLWGRILPEWGTVRDLPPRDSVHTWTVDRHLVETAVYASGFTTRVARPDLLLLGALLHDIGKGRGGDHSVAGARIAERIVARLGLWPSDAAVVCALVRHHLLLPGTATRRDITDPATVAMVVGALDGEVQLLELLHVLAEADSLATGPGVWSEWKASLIGELVQRCRLVMAGEPLPAPDPIDPAWLEIAQTGGVHVDVAAGPSQHMHTVTVIAPDTTGLLAAEAGVLALHALRVLRASVGGHAGCAINTFTVSPKFGPPPPAGLLRQELLRALAGELDLVGALTQKERDAANSVPLRVAKSGVPAAPAAVPSRVIWTETATAGEVLLEVRAIDRLGLLYRLANALEAAGADVRWARVATRGVTAVDVFCLRLSGTRRAEIEQVVATVVPPAAPA